DVPTAVDLHELDAVLGRVAEHVGPVRVAAQGVGRRVLEQEQPVLTRAGRVGVQGPLEGPRLSVGDGAEPAHAERCAGALQRGRGRGRGRDLDRGHSSTAQSRVSRISFTLAMNAAAYAPSKARWSQDRVRLPTEWIPIDSLPCSSVTTTG